MASKIISLLCIAIPVARAQESTSEIKDERKRQLENAEEATKKLLKLAMNKYKTNNINGPIHMMDTRCESAVSGCKGPELAPSNCSITGISFKTDFKITGINCPVAACANCPVVVVPNPPVA